MVKEGIVLRHKVSGSGIEVDKAKIEAISKLPYPINMKAIQSFLGHAGFYRRFIKDFSQIARPMTQILVKDASFNFFEECIQAFDKLKCKLMQAPIMIKPDWSLPFEIMCDISDYAIRAVLGQRIYKHFKPIHHASKTMNEAQENYTTTEKELLAVVFTFDKFCQYLVLSKTFVFTDHSALRSIVSEDMEVVSLPMFAAAKLIVLNTNEFKLWKMWIEYYFLMTDYALWEVILNGDSPLPTRTVDGVETAAPPTNAE
ncbi:reverse transcriptase domain-containing protein [Tanacetum coccineum]